MSGAEDGVVRGDCYGRLEHRWSKPMKSPMHRCTVKVCSRCSRVAKVAR